MSLFKIPFLLSGAVGTWISLTQPTPPPARGEVQRKKGMEKIFGKFGVPIYALMWKTTVIGSLLFDIASIISSPAPPTPLAATLPPLYLLACICTLASGVLRLQCYRALGPLFTFEITLRADHKLVTRGPYAYVRHPSYAAALFGIVGMLVLHFGPGSWFRAVGLLDTSVGWWYAALWTAMNTYVLASMLARVPTEDAMLRDQFKEEWDAWAARVPYRVIPRIY
ncbi:hypothetical protein FA95DRAFT_1547741 [Auriscalpium vulgare]|uniref:Uncharacterized protein n=1 Tax=Auriscalpium vulgare TaxID=40419 RepID=A0ACB8RDU2_9AGAM|nr:hypothetical protein FA95DRAFT_1547741 [Auriscalpium vulgare]